MTVACQGVLRYNGAMSESGWPDITIMVITFDRPTEIRRTLYALSAYLEYGGKLLWHLADDGSPDGYLQSLRDEYPDLQLTVSVTKRQGWAANVNKALASVKTDYVFLCEDDYVCKRPLNLTRGVALLEAVPTVGLVRYDGIAGHDLDLHLREVKTRAGMLNYMTIDRHTSPHLHVYSNRPHLAHRRFRDWYGEYRVGKPLGQTEEDYAFRVKDDEEGPEVAILSDGIARAFKHIGKSRQGTEADPCWKGGLT